MDKIYLLAFGAVCVVTYLCFGSRLYVRLAVAGGFFLCWACVFPNMQFNTAYVMANCVTSFTQHISELLKAEKYEDANKKLTAFNLGFRSVVTDEMEMRRFVENLIALREKVPREQSRIQSTPPMSKKTSNAERRMSSHGSRLTLGS